MTGEEVCPRCGAPLAARQEYCVECGHRHVPRRKPHHWLWPAAAAALVAAGGAAAAIAAGADDADSSTIVALTPLRSKPAPAAQSTKLVRWPRRNGYTIVLSAVPSTAGATAARSRALSAIAAGVPDVGVLDSSRFSSLHPGYWIVFSGVFRSLEDALVGLPKAAKHARGAYTQQIAR
jgi:hypothetical protein